MKAVKDYFNSFDYLSDKLRQQLFNHFINIKAKKLANEAEQLAAKSNEVPELEDPEMDNSRVSRRGDFSLFFNKDMLGLVYMQPLNVKVNTIDGDVSQLYANEEGSVKN